MKVTFSDWRIEDKLQTPEARSAYIQAAAEEGTPDALPDAFADVFRVLGRETEASVCAGLATYLRTIEQPSRKAVVKRSRPTHHRTPSSSRRLVHA